VVAQVEIYISHPAQALMPVGAHHASWQSASRGRSCQLAVGWAWDWEKSETAGSRCQLALTMPVGTFVRRGT